jgi:HAD superfamily hydrolase (TIGR01509 family)
VNGPPRLRAVLFDWDGTLVDSAELSYRIYEELFGSFGLRFDRRAFAASYSPDWYRTFAAVGLPRERWPEADARWLALYAREAVALLPGAREALARASGAGLALALVTSGSRDRVRRDLERLGVEPFFGEVVCGEDARHRKPHPDGLLLALGRLGVAPVEAAYLGDSPEDVAMARAAGSVSVGIPGGFPNRDQLREARPDVLAASLGEALDALGLPRQTASGLD